MIKAAEAQGLGKESVDSIYLKGEEAIAEHEKRNGYDKAYPPTGVILEAPTQWRVAAAT